MLSLPILSFGQRAAHPQFQKTRTDDFLDCGYNEVAHLLLAYLSFQPVGLSCLIGSPAKHRVAVPRHRLDLVCAYLRFRLT